VSRSIRETKILATDFIEVVNVIKVEKVRQKSNPTKL
jgi:hypothetical protein